MQAEVTVLYFAWLRERIGHGEERLALPPGVDRVDRMVDWLAGRGPGYQAAFARRDTVRCAVNQVFAAAGTPVAPGDEIAFFPPVTGG
jgi:molybdopterin synthase sulfur carrier subunit